MVNYACSISIPEPDQDRITVSQFRGRSPFRLRSSTLKRLNENRAAWFDYEKKKNGGYQQHGPEVFVLARFTKMLCMHEAVT